MDIKSAAISFEAVKTSLRQSKDGTTISLAIHPNEVSAAILSAPIGARYQVVLVQKGDDEEPVMPTETEIWNDRRRRTVVQSSPSRAEGERASPSREDEAGVRAVADAGMLCRDPDFQHWIMRFMDEEYPRNEGRAILALRGQLKIDSRKELGYNVDARANFVRLQLEYQRSKEGRTNAR